MQSKFFSVQTPGGTIMRSPNVTLLDRIRLALWTQTKNGATEVSAGNKEVSA
jgi:hypothetical protein